MRGRMTTTLAAGAAAVLAATVRAGCNDQAAPGESSSPSFAIGAPGAYTVAYHVSSDDAPTCIVSIDLVSTEGASEPVVPRTSVASAKPVDASAAPQLGAGTWRFQAAGGCAWKVTVSARA